jgi:HD-like signal output (HDOD) protein
MHAVKISSSDFANRLRQDIVTNRMRLPSLPEVALRVRKAIDCECSAQEIADLVSQDIALSGRLVQIANSPLYRGAAKVDSIMVAVTRLGTRMVKNLVLGLAMRQMFRSSSEVLSKFFRETCDDGIQVAGFCRALADELGGIDPD